MLASVELVADSSACRDGDMRGIERASFVVVVCLWHILRVMMS